MTEPEPSLTPNQLRLRLVASLLALAAGLVALTIAVLLVKSALS